MELGSFSRENPADKIPLMKQWAAIQGLQTILRGHHSGLAYLRALLEKAKAEMASGGYLSEGTRAAITCEFGFWDCLFALQCSHAGPPAAKAETQSFEAEDDKEKKTRRSAPLLSHLSTISWKGLAGSRITH